MTDLLLITPLVRDVLVWLSSEPTRLAARAATLAIPPFRVASAFGAPGGAFERVVTKDAMFRSSFVSVEAMNSLVARIAVRLLDSKSSAAPPEAEDSTRLCDLLACAFLIEVPAFDLNDGFGLRLARITDERSPPRESITSSI